MYFMTQVLFDPNGNESSKGTSSYASMDAAEQAFHTAIASAISKTQYGKAILIVFDADGTVQMRRNWVRG